MEDYDSMNFTNLSLGLFDISVSGFEPVKKYSISIISCLVYHLITSTVNDSTV